MPKDQIYDTPKLDDDQRAALVRRAKAAWFSAGDRETPNDHSTVKVRLGLMYVVLHGASGVLAVYRVRPDTLALRAMKRWPEGVEKVLSTRGEK